MAEALHRHLFASLPAHDVFWYTAASPSESRSKSAHEHEPLLQVEDTEAHCDLLRPRRAGGELQSGGKHKWCAKNGNYR